VAETAREVPPPAHAGGRGGRLAPRMPSLTEIAFRRPGGTTPIVAGRGALAAAAERLAGWLAGRAVFVVTTPRVLALHGGRLGWLGDAAARRVDLEVPEGEAAKRLEVAGGLWERLVAEGGKRDSRLVAFGGGSVGDLGGFVAGCFLRGIEHVQLPTTLLAQVDAAIGGKTAVDLPAAKNSVGLFHDPAAVFADTDVLATLPPEELRSGLAEVVKAALLGDPGLLDRVERELPRLLAGDPEALEPVVAAAAALKVRIVESDPREGGRRRLLNLGHTLGHALESALGYRGLRHGEAVAYGILFALRLAEARGPGWLRPEAGERVRALLGRMELPPLPADGLDPDDLLRRIERDKKARETGLAWVLPASAGSGEAIEGRIVGDVDTALVRSELAELLASPLGRRAASGGPAGAEPPAR